MNARTRTELGHNLRVLRLREGWTQMQLAERAGCLHSMISQYEKGRSEPMMGVAVKLARALGTDLNTLCGERLPPC